jgi:hypothetical protein
MGQSTMSDTTSGQDYLATFNNIADVSMRSALLVEGTGVSGENHRPATSYWQTLSHNVVSNIPRLTEIWTHNDSGDGSIHNLSQ